METGRWIGDAPPVVDAPKEGRWIARPQKPRLILQVGIFVNVLAQVPHWLDITLKPWLGARGSLIGTLAFFLLLLATGGHLLLRERRARRMRAADHALMDASFGDQFPVEVTIVAQGKRLGTDRGVLWFAEGLMGFSGAATSFVLATLDLAPPTTQGTRRGKAGLQRAAIGFRGAPTAGHIVVAPLGSHRKAYQECLDAFFHGRGKTTDERLADVMSRPDVPLGERFWPPLVPYAESPLLKDARKAEAQT